MENSFKSFSYYLIFVFVLIWKGYVAFSLYFFEMQEVNSNK